tara:strand:+ start:270 stop:1031 length:762 start_codon:yes stop_codon:yes gene_type:complete
MADLCINNVQMQFSGVLALNGVTLTVKEGEIFSLVGSNGSGKSTLFNCINGFNRPQIGSIEFGYHDLLEKYPHKIIECGISRTFQNVQNIPFMTVLDNILLGAHHRISAKSTVKRWLFEKQREKEEAMGLEILDFLGIVNYEQKYMAGQPYGIQKLTEIARALVAKPKLILMDEPAAGMNDQETYEIAKIISEIRDELGITVLVIEHDMNLVMSISDRVCVLDSGKVIALGTADYIKKHPDVIDLFLGVSIDA